MTLKELKENAEKILRIQARGGYTLHSFCLNSGGVPRNEVGVKIIRSSSEFLYVTQMNGDAHSGEAVVECRETGAFDSEGRKIYITPDEKAFVFDYMNGDAYSFDSGALVDPKFE